MGDYEKIKRLMAALKAAIRGADHVGAGEQVLWACVMDRFAVGSTVARGLCEWAGEDPERMVTGVCKGCEHLPCEKCGAYACSCEAVEEVE